MSENTIQHSTDLKQHVYRIKKGHIVLIGDDRELCYSGLFSDASKLFLVLEDKQVDHPYLLGKCFSPWNLHFWRVFARDQSEFVLARLPSESVGWQFYQGFTMASATDWGMRGTQAECLERSVKYKSLKRAMTAALILNT
jgi:hypothetical protein